LKLPSPSGEGKSPSAAALYGFCRQKSTDMMPRGVVKGWAREEGYIDSGTHIQSLSVCPHVTGGGEGFWFTLEVVTLAMHALSPSTEHD
jgi:hypothetical protein